MKRVAAGVFVAVLALGMVGCASTPEVKTVSKGDGCLTFWTEYAGFSAAYSVMMDGPTSGFADAADDLAPYVEKIESIHIEGGNGPLEDLAASMRQIVASLKSGNLESFSAAKDQFAAVSSEVQEFCPMP